MPIQIEPQNTIPKKTEAQQRCDDWLAQQFGGPGAKAGANGFTPGGDYRGDTIGDNGQVRGHLSNYAMHLSGSADQTQDTDAFIPRGGSRTLSTTDPAGNTVDLFYYRNLFGQRNVTLAVLHLDRAPITQVGNRLRIGRTGGPGGDGPTDRHIHSELLRRRWSTFPKPAKRIPHHIPLNRLCPPSR